MSNSPKSQEATQSSPQIPESLRLAMLEGTPIDIQERYASLSQIADSTDFGEYDTNIVVLDTETTGVSFRKDELTQIAAARLDKGVITDWYVTFVNPGKPIPDDIVHLTHITDQDVADAPTPEEALAGLVEFVGDAKLVAHNAQFDRNFTTKHPSGYPLLENEWIDSLEISRIALPRMRSHRLVDLVKAFDAPISTHRADDDVVATCALYRLLLAAIITIPDALLTQISLLATPNEWPFGRIYSYFAKLKLQKREAELLTDDERAMGRTILPEDFSLRRMRSARVAEAAAAFTQPLPSAAAFTQPMPQAPAPNQPLPAAQEIDFPTPKQIDFPTPDEIRAAFSRDGLIGHIYGKESLEERAEQTELALAVRDAFANSEDLIAEAGTGTGKSMAYLIPSALTSTRNNIAVGIATKTNALLDQLMYKELPALARALSQRDGIELNYTSLKGFVHYPCLFKIGRIVDQGARLRTVANEQVSQAPALAALLSYVEQTLYDDIDDLKIDYRTLPKSAITTHSAECLRRRCPYFGRDCFVFGARQIAECADIVVTNHALLFRDAASEGALLPPIRYWVVDEAHSAEDDARKALSREISIDALNALARRLSSDSPRTNAILATERAFASSSADPAASTLFFALLSKARAAAGDFIQACDQFTVASAELLCFDPSRKSSYETFDLWMNEEVCQSSIYLQLQATAQHLIERSEKLITPCQELVAFLDDYDHVAAAQRDLASIALDLKDFVQTADSFFINKSDRFVYSATLNRKFKAAGNQDSRMSKPSCIFFVVPYDISQELAETLYESTNSIVFTSATLAVDNSFETFSNSLGLSLETTSTANLRPSFDYDSQMRIFVIEDMPEPSAPSYRSELIKLLIDAHIAQGGSMLTLFTNKRDLDACLDPVTEALKTEGLRLVAQRWGKSVKSISDDFRSDKSLSMFALKSFWEGFDAPGDTLRGVIVPKLPFGMPSDPLSCERKSRNSNAWSMYDLPKAVVELRQAAGRLIRRADDEGILILADSRLAKKGYGRMFLNSLPSKNIAFIKRHEVSEAIRD